MRVVDVLQKPDCAPQEPGCKTQEPEFEYRAPEVVIVKSPFVIDSPGYDLQRPPVNNILRGGKRVPRSPQLFYQVFVGSSILQDILQLPHAL
jgi:hypothetical protein